jgi:predicted PurR-regulated permease PerM
VTKSPEQLDRIRKIVLDIDERVSTYLALKTLMNCLIGGLSYVILKAFGVELAALWALVIGLLNYIPYFGSAVGVTLPVLLMLVQSPDVMIAVYLAIALALAQVLVGNIIEPMAMGRSLNLSPWVILISIAVWGSLWGIAGAVFSVPITAVLVVVMSEFDTTRPVSILLSKDGEVAPLTA